MSRLFTYKSFCWSVGTTSFRTKDFNKTIEEQLQLLNEFWKNPANSNEKWEDNVPLQKRYYAFLKSKGFLSGEAGRPDKDAREKTSGLVEIGLLDKQRRLTEAGKTLLQISLSQDFSPDNALEIQRDSFVYFKQLIKTCNTLDSELNIKVRPFLVFLYVVNKVGYLTKNEFTYLLPLCIDKQTTNFLVAKIHEARENNKELKYDEIILDVLLSKTNYQSALYYFLNSKDVNEEVICEIGINRKSPKYDKKYYGVYTSLKEIVFSHKKNVLDFYRSVQHISQKPWWNKCFFKNIREGNVMREGRGIFKDVPILKSQTLKEFKTHFFRIMHLFKAKATLHDYFDLNRRYFKATDVVIFKDSMVMLDTLPKYYVENIADQIIDLAFEDTDKLALDCTLKDIAEFLEIDSEYLNRKVEEVFGEKIGDSAELRKYIQRERNRRFAKLVDEKFTKETLLNLLVLFEKRKDKEIKDLVTDSADVPTIFEYVLGVIWYIVSDRPENALDFMNLSLGADLLPKTHAGGGEADLVWQYGATEFYGRHTLLLEATLAESTGQRRMEMEPVSRHLGDYRLEHPEQEAYCIFVTTYLHPNVISDFYGRRFMPYYSNDGAKQVRGLKIVPMQTSELKTILINDLRYSQIYAMSKIFYETSSDNSNPLKVYKSCVIYLGQD